MRKCFCRYHALEDVGELGALRSHLAGRLVVFALLARVVGLHELAHVLLEHVVVRRAGHVLPQTRGQPTVIGDDVIFFGGGGGGNPTWRCGGRMASQWRARSSARACRPLKSSSFVSHFLVIIRRRYSCNERQELTTGAIDSLSGRRYRVPTPLGAFVSNISFHTTTRKL